MCHAWSKGFQAPEKKNELALTSMQLNHLCNSASNPCKMPIVSSFLKAVLPFATSSFFSLKMKAPSPTLRSDCFAALGRVSGADRRCACHVLPGPLASGTRAALAVGWLVSLLPGIETRSSRRKVGCILSKGLICFSYFSAKFSWKQQVLGAHKATEPKPHPKAFPRKSSYLKWIARLKVPCYSFVGESVQSSMCTLIHTHPIVTAGGGRGCFHTNVNFERKVKGASALYCVYILKNKVLYVFITLIIVIKSLPFLICGLGGFFVVCFPVWGFCFCFVFLGKKKTKPCF